MRASARARASEHLATFAVLWALAHAIHVTGQTSGRLSVTNWATFVAALWLVANPRSGCRLALLAAVQLIDTAVTLPLAPDHWILVAFVNVFILLDHLSDGTARSPATFATGARFALLISYAAAALAKYNDNFLRAADSCATRIAEAWTFGGVDRTGALAPGAIVLTLLAESALPLLLLFPRTRTAGVLFGTAFHFMVSFSPAIGVGDYSMTLWALLILFLSPDGAAAVGRRVRSVLSPSTVVRNIRRVPPSISIAAACTVVALASRVQDGVLILLAVWSFVTATGVLLLLAVARTIRRDHPATQPLSWLRWEQMAVVACLLVVVSGPYLGFGTAARFTMFSNLRTEGPGTNHLFLPSFHLIDSQNEWLVAEELNRGDGDDHPGIPNSAEFRAAIPVVELRRLLRNPDYSGVFRSDDGSRIEVEAGEAHPLRGGNSWWEQKTQYYRPFALDGVTKSGFCSG